MLVGFKIGFHVAAHVGLGLLGVGIIHLYHRVRQRSAGAIPAMNTDWSRQTHTGGDLLRQEGWERMVAGPHQLHHEICNSQAFDKVP